MYEKTYGSKYKETLEGKDGAWRLGVADIAKLMRADIKAAQKAGELPADLKVSVTVENYSMGRSINMRGLYRPEYWMTCEGHVPGSETYFEDGGYTARSCPNVWCAGRSDALPGSTSHEVLTVEGQRVLKILDGIHWSYNYDGSESQVDYFDRSYWGHADMETAESARWAAEEKARKAQLRTDADERKVLIADIAARTWHKAGRLRTVSTDSLRATKAKLDANAAAKVAS